MGEDQSIQVLPEASFFSMTIEEAADRRNKLVHFVQAIFKEGIDFGKVPGSDRSVLLKPGAEKLCNFFQLRDEPIIVQYTEDWTGDQHGGEPLFSYVYRVRLWWGDRIVAEGDGSCNSREKKYRYRDAEKVCPACGKPTIIRGKPEYNDGVPNWVCFKKKGGCGLTFGDDDPRITSQPVGKVVNMDVADLQNTIIKMAMKRALVAATLIAVNASEFFTQDIEDNVVDGDYSVVDQPKKAPQKPADKPTQKPAQKPTQKPPEQKNQQTYTRPLVPDVLKNLLAQKSKSYAADRKATNTQRGLVVASIEGCFEGDAKLKSERRHSVLERLTGHASIKDMPDGYVLALMDWLKAAKVGDKWTIDEMARQECIGVEHDDLMTNAENATPLDELCAKFHVTRSRLYEIASGVWGWNVMPGDHEDKLVELLQALDQQGEYDINSDLAKTLGEMDKPE